MITASDVSLTVQGTGCVKILNFLTIHDGRATVARMDATFDFAEIPPEFHVQVVNHLLAHRHSMTVWTRTPTLVLAGPPPPSSPATAIARTNPPRKWWQFWRTA